MNCLRNRCLTNGILKAFTLVEVLTVVGVLAIIAAITIPMALNAGVQEANNAYHKSTQGLLTQAFSQMNSEGISTPAMSDFISYLEKGRPLPTAGREFDCPTAIPSDFTWLNCSSGKGLARSGTTPFGVRLKNGSLLVYQNTTDSMDLTTADQKFRFLVDSSGSFDNNPDTARLYYINSDGVVSNP